MGFEKKTAVWVIWIRLQTNQTFVKEITLWLPVVRFPAGAPSPWWKGVCSKEKNFLQKWAKFIPFRLLE